MVINAWHRWLLVQCAADAMAVEILDNAESTLTCATLHGSPNVPKFASGPGGIHGFKLSKSSRAQESLGQGRYFANRVLAPVSAQYPSNSAETSMLTRSPGEASESETECRAPLHYSD